MPQCQYGEFASPNYRCPETATFVYVLRKPLSALEARPYHSCTAHRMSESNGDPCGTPLTLATGVRRRGLKEMAVARNRACNRRSRTMITCICRWYGPLRRLTRLRRHERASQ